jgi:NAD(P)-dependent dehydrogenase (short-subunit alcohol dehydrogenase family)
MDFTGKHVVVTGGTGALGTAIISRLLTAGASCHIPAFVNHEVDRFPHAGHERVRIETGVNLADEEAVRAFYADCPELWASIHVAGGFAMAALADTTKADFMGQVEMNALTCFLCCREAVARIRATGKGGRIVNVAARPALEPRLGAGLSAYTASKAAVAALTQSLGEELADEGIWVNAVAPSIIDTPANRAGMPKADHAAWPKTDEIAATILHLAAPENAVARGAVVPVYGRS